MPLHHFVCNSPLLCNSYVCTCVCVCPYVWVCVKPHRLQDGNLSSSFVLILFVAPSPGPHPVPSPPQVISEWFLIKSCLTPSALAPEVCSLPSRASVLGFLLLCWCDFRARHSMKKLRKGHPTLKRGPWGHLDKIHTYVHSFPFCRIK